MPQTDVLSLHTSTRDRRGYSQRKISAFFHRERNVWDGNPVYNRNHWNPTIHRGIRNAGVCQRCYEPTGGDIKLLLDCQRLLSDKELETLSILH